MAGKCDIAVVAITASSGTSHTATNTALAAKTKTFRPVNLNDCPTLHTGYPTGGCVAQLQTDLNIMQDNSLTVDGIFGPVDSQTYKAVIAFQGAHGLQQDGMVGPATKQALDAALSVHPPTGALLSAALSAHGRGSMCMFRQVVDGGVVWCWRRGGQAGWSPGSSLLKRRRGLRWLRGGARRAWPAGRRRAGRGSWRRAGPTGRRRAAGARRHDGRPGSLPATSAVPRRG